MATTGTLSSPATVRAAPIFAAFPPPAHSQASLTRAINVLWGLSVAYFAAGAAYCTYKLYTAYQCYQHTSFGLPDELKFVKCRALLLDAREKKAAGENIQPLMQECESLLNSITTRYLSYEKGTHLLTLVQYYVTTDHEHAYSIALGLSSAPQLFEAAQIIQKRCPTFDQTKLGILYERAAAVRDGDKTAEAKRLKEEKKAPRENSFSDVNWELKMAVAFHSVGDTQNTKTCVSKAWSIATSFAEPLTRMNALCEIAKCSHQIDDHASIEQSVAQAEQLISKIPIELLVQARLSLSKTYLAIGYTVEMERELRNVWLFFHENPTEIYKDLYLFAQCISTFSKDPQYDSGFSSKDVKSSITKALESLKLPRKELANAYLNIARIYQEKLVEDADAEAAIKKLAHEEIGGLPRASEEDSDSKIDLLISLGSLIDYKQEPAMAIAVSARLKLLYESCPFERNENVNWDKASLGISIVKFYNEMKMEVESNAFFEKYITFLISRKDQTATSKISQLATTVRHSHSSFSPEQRNRLLQEAEKLLPGLSSYACQSCFEHVANGYLHVNRVRSLILLRDWESYQARSSAITAVVTAALMGTTYFYPEASYLLLLGVTVLRMF